MTIDVKLTQNWPGGPSSYVIKVPCGETVCGITDETPKAAVDRFIELCKEHEAELDALCIAARDKIAWNIQANKSGGKGRNWPEFARKERLVKRLLDQAGVIDS